MNDIKCSVNQDGRLSAVFLLHGQMRGESQLSLEIVKSQLPLIEGELEKIPGNVSVIILIEMSWKVTFIACGHW